MFQDQRCPVQWKTTGTLPATSSPNTHGRASKAATYNLIKNWLKVKKNLIGQNDNKIFYVIYLPVVWSILITVKAECSWFSYLFSLMLIAWIFNKLVYRSFQWKNDKCIKLVCTAWIWKRTIAIKWFLYFMKLAAN